MPSAGSMPPGFVMRNWKKVLKVSAGITKGTAAVVNALPAEQHFVVVSRITTPSLVVVVVADPFKVRPLVDEKFGNERVCAKAGIHSKLKASGKRSQGFL
jgi:hypothetical protein